MTPCIDCGGPSRKGWSDGNQHIRCVTCEVGATVGIRTAPLTAETVARLVLVAARTFDVLPRDVISRTREQRIVRVRAALYCALYEAYPKTTHRALGAFFDRDPEVICKARRLAYEWAQADPHYAEGLTRLRQEAMNAS